MRTSSVRGDCPHSSVDSRGHALPAGVSFHSACGAFAVTAEGPFRQASVIIPRLGEYSVAKLCEGSADNRAWSHRAQRTLRKELQPGWWPRLSHAAFPARRQPPKRAIEKLQADILPTREH